METRSNHVLVGTVTLLLLAAIIGAAFWFSRLSDGENKEYDIFFKQSVNGLAKGSSVNYSGVPSGQVEKIELWKRDPGFVKVRISVKDGTPVLQGTTATIAGVGFTGVSEIVLDGAVKGAPPIICPANNPLTVCPDGVPVIPTKPGALGELLNNAPQLLERLSTLTERLTELLNDKNQQSIAGILANVERISSSLADRSPEISATLAEARIAVQRTGVAAEQIGKLAATTDSLLTDEGKPLMADLRKSVQSATRSIDTLDKTIAEAQPGVRAFSNQTMPEVNQLVRDLREMSRAFRGVAEKLDQQGAGSLVGSPKLPDYKP
ncbi:MAG: MCE family protein [Sphingobium sp.]|mgnify:FL=1|jgi:phospholipid/cholesterol/gamma-HCH transport system substrate-binding protein|uniref:MCE family protein n=1 Tax=Sphingobium xenophagum TaxID=121428 RepID=A0A249MSD9_SPHXE|nr:MULTISPECIES: MlaD family protein [Sphingobium]MBU0659753.1 MCE family protein [Alphaproteobacteria bacterium]ODT87415.1 MAG: mammalian cell entry protein [Sphingobium sp. SCN 64-10]ASY44047.1 MCE family protein [Sphingobium xenophagum]MBA4755251.1 MCE family protein [Sphingobium sp.]MBG6118323.1 phospholipid/cholesterol/gamma-HCH transport system substrate-binding protein [Sphingobium sp. JAI105]|tara:strand:+ start:1548 stop:2510 length:963 start_codon:yes stop_codon:yes gene_type:complete